MIRREAVTICSIRKAAASCWTFESQEWEFAPDNSWMAMSFRMTKTSTADIGVGSQSIFTGSGRFSSTTLLRRLLVAAFMPSPSSLRFAVGFRTSTSPLMLSTRRRSPRCKGMYHKMHQPGLVGHVFSEARHCKGRRSQLIGCVIKRGIFPPLTGVRIFQAMQLVKVESRCQHRGIIENSSK